MRQPPSPRNSRRSHSIGAASTWMVLSSGTVIPSKIWENGTVCTIPWSLRSDVRIRAEMSISPLMISLLPICWLLVTRGSTWFSSISSAPLGPMSNSCAVVQDRSSTILSSESCCFFCRSCRPFPSAPQHRRRVFLPKPSTVSSGITRRYSFRPVMSFASHRSSLLCTCSIWHSRSLGSLSSQEKGTITVTLCRPSVSSERYSMLTRTSPRIIPSAGCFSRTSSSPLASRILEAVAQ